jgi:tetratricopeptide (TPR) repeat protein
VVVWAVASGAVCGEPLGRAAADEAPAAADEAHQKARAAFERGRTLYRLTRFDEALTEFAAAYQLLPEPAFLYNIAQCQRELGHDEAAVKAYEQYLATAPSDDPSRSEVEKTIATLGARIADRTRQGEKLRILEGERALEQAREQRLSAERDLGGTRDGRAHARALVLSGSVLGGLGIGSLIGGIATSALMANARSTLLADAHSGAVYDPAIGQRYDLDRTLTIALFSAGATVAVVGAALLGRGLWERRHPRATP